MPDEEKVEEETQEETSGVSLSPEEHAALLEAARQGAAVAAGFDMENPATALVIEKHWKPDITIEDFKKVGEQYNVLVPEKPVETSDPVEGFPTRSGPEGEQGAADILDSLNNGAPLPDLPPLIADPHARAREIVKQEMEKGRPREEAMTVALDDLLRANGKQAAYARVKARRDEEARVAEMLRNA